MPSYMCRYLNIFSSTMLRCMLVMSLVVLVVEYGARCEDKPFTKWKDEHDVDQEKFKKTKTRRRNVGK